MTAVTTSDVAAALTLTLSLDRGCRFSLFSAKPCTPMLNFLLARAPRSRKSTASRQGEGTEMDRRSEADLAQERIHCVEQAARIVALDVVAGVLDTHPSRVRQHMSESLRSVVR